MIGERVSAFEVDEQIRHYVATGNHNGNFIGWPGRNFVETAMQAAAGFRDALVNEVLGIQVTFKPANPRG